jgi:hypothetical protein
MADVSDKEDVVVLINLPILAVVVLIMNELVTYLIDERVLVIVVEMLRLFDKDFRNVWVLDDTPFIVK